MDPNPEVIVLSDSSDGSTDGSSEESTQISCEDCRMEKDLPMTIKGPRWAADDPYDEYCVYPNRVGMLPSEVVILKDICDLQKPRIPIYVCTIREAHISEEKNKGKMYFNKAFTKDYLKNYMTRSGYEMRVYYENAKKMKEVKIKLDKAGKCAMMTSKWMSIVTDQSYGEGEVVMFWFRRTHEERKLKLYVDRIWPGCFGFDIQYHMQLLAAAGM